MYKLNQMVQRPFTTSSKQMKQGHSTAR